MLRIYAPDPAPKAVIALPDPEWGDTQRLESTMQLRRSMNGQRIITYVRRKENCRTYELSLVLTRPKAEEFIRFFELFGSQKMKLEFDKDTSKIGYIKMNPIQLEFVRRAVNCDSYEEVTTEFAFESIQ
jgi:hypothetical protein